MVPLPPDTIAAFLAAAPERFAEGTLLLNSRHHGGAVYLFGYVAELVLKAIAFRHYGYAPTVPIKDKDRKAVESLMKEEALVPAGPHDILKWAQWVVSTKERLTGAAYPLGRGMDLEHQAGVFGTLWSPSMRYHVLMLSLTDALTAQRAARWLLTEEPSL